MTRKSISQSFATLREKNQLGLVAFISAGYPDLATTAEVMKSVDKAGATVIEIGFPFSDPVADGPIIQESYNVALKKGLSVDQIFKAIASVRADVSAPIVAMVSFSIVFRYGLEKFIANSKAAGIDGLLLPDLPPPEAQKVCDKIRAGGLDTVLLIAPTTSPDRRKEIASLCSGFVYYLSVAGITGVRDSLPANLEANLAQLKSVTDRPICVGFGISKPEHMKQLKGKADAAIVGSAIISRIKQAEAQSPVAIGDTVAQYCKSLLA